MAGPALAQTPLADQPPFSTNAVPGNVALTLSTEWPTLVRSAHTSVTYSSAARYLGYFDTEKCYAYSYVDAAAETATNVSHFYPVGAAVNRRCNGQWSGNYLNWASTPTIDPFRWALTGGYRVVDEPARTILQKSRHDNQGNLAPDKAVIVAGDVSGATPFGNLTIVSRTQGLGIRMRISTVGNLGQPVDPYTPAVTAMALDRSYDIMMRVRVCDPSALAGGVEANCRQYGSNWKPEGLIHQYSDRMSFSVFGYLNDSDVFRDGAVLRAQQKFVAPLRPVPSAPSAANALAEWDAATGVYAPNPDSADAAQTNADFAPSVPVANSGVINYLNKFGQLNTNSYKAYDPVSELYYTALRYFKNQGSVPEYSNMGAASAATRSQYLDNFPAITRWADPIQYACQRNFVLGIGDIYTHRDKNLPGNGTGNADEPAKPGLVSGDTTVDSVDFTNRAFALQGLGAPNQNDYSGRNNSANIVGLAYHAHTQDIRPDNAAAPQTLGRQTVDTYWVDVLEAPFEANNQFYLAAKYGGFVVPNGYDPLTQTAALPQASWFTNGDNSLGQPRPDNYFTAGRPDTMVAGLTAAFANIASNLRATTTSFSTPSPQIAGIGTQSYSSQFNAQTWTSEIEAASLTFNPPSYAPVLTTQWRASERLAAQLAGAGWDTNRRIATWSGNQGVAFRATGASSIAAAQLATLDTAYIAADDRAQFLNYLRGDRSNEVGQTGALGYRVRDVLLGDIVNSKVTVVAGPPLSYSDAFNPGYDAFVAANRTRTPMVYVGANDGMLHAFSGDAGAAGGTEVFAYVPSVLFSGPNNTPNVNGLAALGNPNFVHHYYVDGAIKVTDIDLARTGGPITGNPTPNWRSVLIGGLGKGGRSYYAIDVTNPAGMTTEADVAANVLWEFPNNNTPVADRALFGFSYGQAMVTKTARWGWVVVLTSGYNNPDGRGHIFFVNPANGDLLERVDTTAGGVATPAGLAHVQVFATNFTDNTAESLYAGDLLGNVWRVDVRGAGAYQSANNPLLIAQATASNGTAQPITSRVRIAIHPRDNRRYVMFGTGRLLDTSDLGNTQPETFYAIQDGTLGAFNTQTPNTLPTGVTFPITRANLAPNANLSAGFTADPTRPMGWFVELGNNAAGAGWRVINEADIFYSEVAFASIVPGGDACSPGGNSRIYALDFSTGQTTLRQTPPGGGVAQRVDFSTAVTGIVTDLRYVNRNGTAELIAGGSGGGVSNIERAPLTGMGLRRLNWRELPAPQ